MSLGEKPWRRRSCSGEEGPHLAEEARRSPLGGHHDVMPGLEGEVSPEPGEGLPRGPVSEAEGVSVEEEEIP